MICPNCGAPLPDTAKMCYVCKNVFKSDVNGGNTGAGANRNPYNGNGTNSGPPSGLTYNQREQNRPAPRQPQQMYVNNPNWNKPVKKKGEFYPVVIALLCGFAVIVLLLAASGRSRSGDDSSDYSRERTTEEKTTREKRTLTEETTTEEPTTEESLNNSITVASDFSNMKLGEICNDDDLYIGLSYAKLSDSFYTALDSQEEIGADNQVLYAFFDVYNASASKTNIFDDLFTCYVDGTNYNSVDTYFHYEVDGIYSDLSDDLYDNTNKLVITNFEIPKEWSEIKLYYGSDCIWVLSPEDVSSEPFEMKSMYDVDYTRDGTSEGTTVYSDKYEIVYDGYEYFTTSYTNDKYLIVKLTINNTSDSELDYSLVGYNMNCYQNNYALQSASFTVNDKISDYVNVFDIDSIQAGMSAKVYLAFEINEESGFYRVVYDVGYGSEERLTDIYIDAGKTATDTDPE